MKKVLAVFVALVVALGIVGLGFAQDVKGTVTKIEAKKITVKDEQGKETAVEVKDTARAKKGDVVEIKGGVVKIVRKAPGY